MGAELPAPRAARGVRFAVTGASIVVAVVLASLAGPRPPRHARPPSMPEAVERTLAAGSARIRGTITSPDGATGRMDGITSFHRHESSFLARSTTAHPPQWSEVRVTGGRAWLRPPGSTTWVELDPEAAGAGPGGGWTRLLSQLHGTSDVRAVDGAGRQLRGRLGPRRVAVRLDGAGRIARLRLSGDGTLLDVDLRDHGVPVRIQAP